MKLGKTSWLILVIGICVIAFASVGFARAQRTDEQTRLQEELSVAKLRLSKIQLKELALQERELEEQLDRAISRLEAARTEFSQPNESISVSGSLFDIARTCDVEITEISSSGLEEGDLESVGCSVLPITLKAEGDIANLIEFVIRLNNDFRTGLVESVEIGIPETGEEQPQVAPRPSVCISMVVYSYYEGS